MEPCDPSDGSGSDRSCLDDGGVTRVSGARRVPGPTPYHRTPVSSMESSPSQQLRDTTQFRENLADRQAAEAVRTRIDWKYLLSLDLTEPGFDFSVLSEFRDRLLAGSAEELLLDKLLERCRALGLLKARGQQRTDSTHVLAAVRVLSLLPTSPRESRLSMAYSHP